MISAVTEYNNLVINHIKGDKERDYSKQHDRLLSRCFKEMRADLYGGKNKINKNYLDEITFLVGVLRIKK
ncbi:hypothetical protein ACJDU8_01950 [Clostridium sp. WILCCON 0269]|uniref:Uncharacterized protein n=1 Tax=Candidatus Clostridium eludens TaxID=3381663 RepID=A0ABW8SFN6_9CLOT